VETLGKDHVEHLARTTGFVKRSSRVNGKNFLDLLLSHATQGALLSLEDLSRDFEVAHEASISKQGLDERFTSAAVLFLKSILNALMDNHMLGIPQSGTEKRFTSCRLRDSTRFGLPEEYASKYKGHGGATQTKSMISIQHEFDVLTGHQLDLQLTSGCQNDQGDSSQSIKDVKEGELLIRDLGYVTTTYLSGVTKQRAYFLNRLPSQINVYDPGSNELINLKNVYKKLKRYNIPYIEFNVLIGKKAQLPCRLVVSACEDNAAKKRLKRTTRNTKSTGHKVSEETRWRSRLNLYITNAPEEKIHAKDVYHVYRMRWQIELIFKVWKSIANIDKLKKVKMERFECILLSGLIWVLANWKIFQVANSWLQGLEDEPKTLSIWKYYKFIAGFPDKICSIVQAKEQMHEWLSIILALSESKLYRETKKGELSHIQLLCLLKSA